MFFSIGLTHLCGSFVHRKKNMKLVSYSENGYPRLGFLLNNLVYDLNDINEDIPDNMLDLLIGGEPMMEMAKQAEAEAKQGLHRDCSDPLETVTLLAPVPYPTSCRDGYAFRQHVATARRNRGLEMIPEFDQYPIFYFTNHNAIQGPGPISCMPDHFQKLDFELEAAVVIGKKGRNIKAEEADNYIAGYLIMNDMSARTLQMEEMKLNLGPAKGKDFSTVIGPWLVTPDELKPYLVAPPKGHVGNQYNLNMQCWVNGKLVSQGNMAQMDWTFAEIIERCAYGVDIHPGDVIGSGTVGTGCFLELNGTNKLNNPQYEEQWLQAGDEVVMEITGLGTLINTIVAENTDFSILNRKK